MGGVDVSKIREGDEVDIRVRVTRVDMDGDPHFAGPGFDDDWLPKSWVVAHHPKPREIKVGDIVTWNTVHTPYKVLHVHGKQAWLLGFGLRKLDGLKHCNDEGC